MTDWLTTGWLNDWLTDWLTDWFTNLLTDWPTYLLTYCLIDLLTYLLARWLTGWLTDWLIYWLTDDVVTDKETESDWPSSVLTGFSVAVWDRWCDLGAFEARLECVALPTTSFIDSRTTDLCRHCPFLHTYAANAMYCTAVMPYNT